jgi:hypothetical protein
MINRNTSLWTIIRRYCDETALYLPNPSGGYPWPALNPGALKGGYSMRTLSVAETKDVSGGCFLFCLPKICLPTFCEPKPVCAPKPICAPAKGCW